MALYSVQYGFGPMSISCTLHFKSDAEKPWVTKESISSIHYWFNPEKEVEQTLIEMVEQIEAWMDYDYRETLQKSYATHGYVMNILNMEICGVKYTHEELATMVTIKYIHNEEPFTLRYHARDGNVEATWGTCIIL